MMTDLFIRVNEPARRQQTKQEASANESTDIVSHWFCHVPLRPHLSGNVDGFVKSYEAPVRCRHNFDFQSAK